MDRPDTENDPETDAEIEPVMDSEMEHLEGEMGRKSDALLFGTTPRILVWRLMGQGSKNLETGGPWRR